jgi:hypothetical protein
MSQDFSLAYARGLRTEAAEMRSGGAGALNNYFSYREGAGNNLELILGAAAAAGHRKTKGQGSKNASEGVSKP